MMQRYLIGALGFAVAAVWLGVGLTKGMECLLAFLLTTLIVSVVQVRRRAVARSRGRRSTTSDPRDGRRRAVAEHGERRHSSRPELRPRPSPAVYDDDAFDDDWPRLADRYR